MVAKPAPCWQCLEEQHQLYTAGPKGIDYMPDLSDTQASGTYSDWGVWAGRK